MVFQVIENLIRLLEVSVHAVEVHDGVVGDEIRLEVDMVHELQDFFNQAVIPHVFVDEIKDFVAHDFRKLKAAVVVGLKERNNLRFLGISVNHLLNLVVQEFLQNFVEIKVLIGFDQRGVL